MLPRLFILTGLSRLTQNITCQAFYCISVKLNANLYLTSCKTKCEAVRNMLTKLVQVMCYKTSNSKSRNGLHEIGEIEPRGDKLRTKCLVRSGLHSQYYVNTNVGKTTCKWRQKTT